jgi:hypothetical protein
MTTQTAGNPKGNPAARQEAILRALNIRHRRFWRRQSAIALKRLSDPALFKLAFRDMRSEEQRGIPVKHRKSLELALEDASTISLEVAKDTFVLAHREFSRKGGLARAPSPLQNLIENIVRQAPKLDRNGLMLRLKQESGEGVIASVDRTFISYFAHDGSVRTSRVSGLKDRLSRAKEKISSRLPVVAI